MAKRAFVTYRGMVQGVGFRYTARTLANQFEVSGYVKNITNGSVELVAEGEAEEVQGFLDAVDERMGDLVRSKDVGWSPGTGEFRGFAIRF